MAGLNGTYDLKNIRDGSDYFCIHLAANITENNILIYQIFTTLR